MTMALPESSLVKQKQALKTYMDTPSFKQQPPIQQADVKKQKEQIEEALEAQGEVDPALRLNPRYRKGSRSNG